MAFKAGDPRPKGAGRKRGIPNKNTLILDAFAQTIVEEGMEKFRTELNNLEGEQYLDIFMKLFEYVKPKLNRTEHSGTTINYNVELTAEKAKQIHKHLHDEC